MNIASEKFRINFKRLREEKGVTLYQMSKEIELSYPQLHAIENGDRSPGFQAIDKIANYFNVEIHELFI